MLVALKRRLFGSQTTVSKKRAKSRLHFVLVQDRTGLSGEEMAKFKQELIAIVEKYFVIDKQGFDVSYKRDTEATTLLINSPVVVRRQETPGGTVGSERLQRHRPKDEKPKEEAEQVAV